jgi:hypothetical protein
MSNNWNNDTLQNFRGMGDPYADALVSKTLGKGEAGIETYNRMLLLANQLIENPGLLLVEQSTLAQEFENNIKDPGLAAYFKPMEAPAWVDPDKLALASEVWKQNTVVAMGVLYAASLPLCYLIKNGIPALYDTGKLLEPYLSQRIYETGLLLDSILDSHGLSIIEDKEYDHGKVLLDELNKSDPKGQWERRGNALCRCGDSAKATEAAKTEAIVTAVNERMQSSQRYLWGKGYLTAKKVRFLHASMRYMLLNPQSFEPHEQNKGATKPLMQLFSERREPWNTQELGYPVNQEDQAYTLLTFGLIIPKGLERWGVSLSQEEKDAFLHLWKVIGYTLGIEEQLLTDRWDEAEELFAMIQARQAGGSEDGVKLTDALIDLLDQYLPTLPGVAENCLPVELMISQIGDKFARDLIRADRLKEARRPWRRPIYAVLGFAAKSYFFLRSRFLAGFPLWGDLTTQLVHEVAEGMIESWRDAYRRAPFFVPSNLTTWQRIPGADPAYLHTLKDWRQGVLMTAGFALGLLVVSVFGAAASLPLLLLYGEGAFLAALGFSGAAWMVFARTAKKRLNALLAERPEPDRRICKHASSAGSPHDCCDKLEAAQTEAA